VKASLTVLLLLCASVPVPVRAADTVDIRGKAQPVAILKAPGKPRGAVLLLPGDGGWRGLAVTMGQTIASWGYNVYGFDTKHYLESFSEGRSALTVDQMSRDLDSLISWMRNREPSPVTVFGWSQGAAMGILAAVASNPDLEGVVTLGLPDRAVLGWNWRDMLAAAARLNPNEPYFEIEPLLRRTPGTPLWMIYGSADEYTNPASTKRLFAAANEPKHIVQVPGANHRFDSRTEELYQALRDGLLWVKQAHAAAQR
jgi:dienelactone hydrolase